MEDRARAALVASCILLLAVSCGDGGPPSTPAPASTSGTAASEPEVPQLEILQRVATGGEPIGITEGFGSVWVVNSEFRSGGEPTVARIDPATGTVVASIGVGAVPLEVLAAGDAVWVSNSADATVSRIRLPPPTE